MWLCVFSFAKTMICGLNMMWLIFGKFLHQLVGLGIYFSVQFICCYSKYMAPQSKGLAHSSPLFLLWQASGALAEGDWPRGARAL